jgi:Trypsin
VNGRFSLAVGMSKPPWMGLRCVFASVAALVAAAAWCSPAMAVVGGSAVSLTDHPYQVALTRPAQTAEDGQFCGGSIRDPLHIITAAHCVWDNAAGAEGQPISVSQVDVLAGAENLHLESAGERRAVQRISVDPSYPTSPEHDAAVLTLASPLTLGAKEQPVELVTYAESSALSPPAPLFVTGWGDTTGNSTYPLTVRGTSVPFVSDDVCEADYRDNWIIPIEMSPDLQLCAGDEDNDACFGDSGGPLVIPHDALPADDRLVGIVSAGGPGGCADAAFPGIYTEVSWPSTRSFLTLVDPPAAPVTQSPPTITGNAVIGQTLTCSPGVWTGSPSFSYQFVRSNPSLVDVGVASNGSATYTVTAADAGTALRCVVTATNAGGTSIAESARTAIVPGVAQPNPPQANLDTNAPVAKVTKTRCTTTRCTLSVRVTDAGYSAGIKSVQASVTSTYRTTCRKKGRKVRCTRHKTKKLSAKRLTTTTFQVVASKLPVGKQVFTLYAVDKANHKQRLPTKKTVTTKRKKKRR